MWFTQRQFKSVQPMSKKETKFEEIPLVLKLATAGVAGCLADLVTFPLDVAKVRLQVQGSKEGSNGLIRSCKPTGTNTRYKGVFNTIVLISKEEGPRSLYNGLAAGVQRQMCFASIRIGLYDSVKEYYQKFTGYNEEKKHMDIPIRISAGMTTGALSVFVAQPTDVVKIRFQAALPGTVDRYKTTIEAYKTIFKREGFRGLWKGTLPNVARNAIVNVSEIVCYDLVKESILKRKWLEDNIICHFTSGVIAGFCTTVIASPVDVIKTRYMNSRKGEYKSAVDATIKTAQKEGLKAFYKGFVPSFYRLVAWNIVMWVSYEELKLLAANLVNEIS